MKKIILTLAFCALTFSMQAQNNSDTTIPYQGVEAISDLNLTADQVAKLKKLKREIGPQFAAIGRDRTLSGREKGEKKRALALKHRADIQNILTAKQLTTLEDKYGTITETNSIRDNISNSYDAKLDRLERKYEADEAAIENDNFLSRDQKKTKRKALKATYKSQKEALKVEKNQAKNSVLLGH